MNPLTNVRNIQKLNQTELQLGGKKSWHDQYKDSAWIFIGGLPYDLTEGDILCVFSQYGEIVNINLVRDKGTGKSKGYGFICYEDQRSTVLAVDNLNSIKLVGRVIRVDHVESYKVPKEHGDEDDLTKKLRDEGCAPKLASSSEGEEEEEAYIVPVKKVKKEKEPDKKSKKKKKKEKKKKKAESSSSEDERSHDRNQPMRIKKEKHDSGYEQHNPMRESERFDRDRRERDGGFERDFGDPIRDGNRFDRDRRERDGGFERDFGDQNRDERFDRNRRERNGAFERDSGDPNRDERFDRNRRERDGGFERDSGFGFGNGVHRFQDRRNDRGRDDRRDGWRDRESEYKRGDNRDERQRSDYHDRNRREDRRDGYRDRYNRNR